MKRWLWAVLLTYIAFSVIYGFVEPLGEAPDEAPHFTVIRYISIHHRLPGAEEHEAFQPPLYYLLGAAITAPFDLSGYRVIANSNFDLHDPKATKNLLLHGRAECFPYAPWAKAWHLLRLFSTLLGLATLFFLWRLLRHVFTEWQPALIGIGLVAFSPGFLFLTGAVNNDDLAMAIAALFLWQGVEFAESPEWKKGLFLGTLWGLGVMSKVSLLGLGLPWAMFVGWAYLRKRDRKALAVWIAEGIAAFVVVAGWWFVRNVSLYGDPMAWPLVMKTNALRKGPFTAGLLWWLAKGVYKSWWLDYVGLHQPTWLYGVLGLIPLVALIGWAFPATKFWTKHGKTVGLVLAFYFLEVAMALIRWTAMVLGTGQARLLFPALAFFALFLGGGVWRLHRRWRTFAPSLLLLGLTLVALWTPWGVIRATYARPKYAPAPLTPPKAWFGDIGLQEFEVSRKAVQRGETVDLKLVWRSPKLKNGEHLPDLWATVWLKSENGKVVWARSGSPSAGRDTTDCWPSDSLIPSLHRIPVPKGLPPGKYLLETGLHSPGKWNWLEVIVGGKPAGDQYTLATIEVK